MTKYIVTVNRPGYMPDEPGTPCETWQEAIDCALQDIEITLDNAIMGLETEDESEALETEAANAQDQILRSLPPHVSVTLAGYVHEIAPVA